MAQILSIISLFTLSAQTILAYTDILPPLPEKVRSSINLPDHGVVRFYPVTKRGGPMERALLPWHPKQQESEESQKLYFNIESEQRGVLYRIKLKRNQNLFSKKVSQSLHYRQQDLYCLFSGVIVGDSTSTVGMNLCTGMASILSSVDGEFLLAPLSKEELHRHEWMLSMKKVGLPKEKRKTTPEGDGIAEELSRVRRASSSSHRSSRLLTQKRNIEILVVADRTMVKKYGTEEATTYILTVMNMVSSLYKDKSLKADINIVLAGLVFLNGNETGLEIGHRADDTLNNFCEWQAGLKNEIHHDHAILMTGVDICVDKNGPCDTIGYAPIRGMCSRARSCTVNEDRGLGVAFTIAHEIGHNLGMVHDGSSNNCTDDGSIMGPSLTTNTGTFFWSKCNQRQLDDFLESSQANCMLEDAPVKSEMYNMSITELPGQVYSGDQQCKHLYGSEASVCKFELPNDADICRYLWCHVGGMRCETKFLPAAEGTPCDENKWCREGECIPVNKETPEPIDGDWDKWTDWTPCTRTCGGGVQTRMRYCTNPSPRYGGQYCSGDSKEYGRCNMQSCAGDEKEFRAMQCTEFDEQPFKGRYFKWSPVDNRYLSTMDKCKLFCRAARYNFFFQMNDKVIDGTRCDDESDDVCINGKCQPVGCDGEIWSEAKADKCGVCNGNGTTCETIRGLFADKVTSNNYTTFLTIPVGAKSIQIKELRSSSSFIAVKSKSRYYLNGDWSMDWPGKFYFAGSKFVYNRLYSGLETLYSTGPTNETLEIQILAVGANPGVQYEYVVPIDTSKVRYTWESTTTDCSEQCGGGIQEMSAICVASDGSQATNDQCIASHKPTTGRFKCNAQPCPGRWIPQAWSRCSRQCGGGKQRREIYCMQRFQDGDRRVKNKHCKSVPRPPKTQRCNLEDCAPAWQTGRWSKCSTTCGNGIRRRAVYCTMPSRRDAVVSDNECDSDTKPTIYESCSERDCEVDWQLTSWSQCSKSCELGSQSRQLICVSKEPGATPNTAVDTRQCEHMLKPKVLLLQNCQLQETCPHWQPESWSECSSTCGESERRRRVTCQLESGVFASGCDERDRPSEIQRCHLPECSITSQTTPSTTTTQTTTTTAAQTTASSCVDTKSWCPSLSIYKYYCTRSYYRSVCCQTCSLER